MSKLITELQRLYFLDDQHWHSQHADASGNPAYSVAGTLTSEIVAASLAGEKTIALQLASPEGMARAMVVVFDKPGDWGEVANLYQAVQDELDLPAPAIAVSGRKGFRLWFSLAEPVAVVEIQSFLDALGRKYLADIPQNHRQFRPAADLPNDTAPAVINLAPARHTVTGKWSAFIDPSLGGMFIEEPGLEMAPNMDRQASILAGLASIKVADFQRALGILLAPAESDAAGLSSPERPASQPDEAASPRSPDAGHPNSLRHVGNHYSDPQSFLLAVMNDSSASPRHRIEAAKALLPFFSNNA
jgi:hypothetical protein